MARSLFLICLVTSLLGGAFWKAIAVRSFLASASAAPGAVIELEAGGSHPRIAFTTAGGERVTYSQGGFIFGFAVGDQVTVLYRQDAPAQTATIDRPGALWFVPGILGGLGLLSFFAFVSTVLG